MSSKGMVMESWRKEGLMEVLTIDNIKDGHRGRIWWFLYLGLSESLSDS